MIKNSIFISGSRSIKHLDTFTKETIEHCIKNECTILVGDCYGVDSLVQNYVKSLNYMNVIVYHIGLRPRYNVNFKTKQINGNSFYIKDIAMSDDCEEAFIIMENNSRGSLNNYKRISKMSKEVLLHKV